MKKFKTIILFFIISLQFTALGDEVLMAFGEKIPPFVFPDSDSGIELEVIRESLAYKGHTLKPLYYPLARVPLSFKAKEVDAAMTDLGIDLTSYGGFYGNPAVFYNNVFISLKERNITISKPSDLDGLSIFSFQGALKRYPEWLSSVNDQGHYAESNKQEAQVKVLLGKRYDVILSDRTIFRYFLLQNKIKNNRKLVSENRKINSLPLITEHSFSKLKPNDYRPVFRSEKIRNDFNEGLIQLKKSGRFQAIYDKYLIE